MDRPGRQAHFHTPPYTSMTLDCPDLWCENFLPRRPLTTPPNAASDPFPRSKARKNSVHDFPAVLNSDEVVSLAWIRFQKSRLARTYASNREKGECSEAWWSLYIWLEWEMAGNADALVRIVGAVFGFFPCFSGGRPHRPYFSQSRISSRPRLCCARNVHAQVNISSGEKNVRRG